MEFDWVKVAVKTPAHPKVQRLEKLLGIEDGLGCAVRLWCWAAAYAPDGEFARPDIDAAAKAVIGDVPTLRNAGVTRVTEALVTAGLIDDKSDRYEVHDWLQYQAAHADKAERDREQNRERQRRFRNRKRNAPVTRDRNVTGNVTGVTVERYQEESRGEENKATAQAGPDAPALAPVAAAPVPPLRSFPTRGAARDAQRARRFPLVTRLHELLAVPFPDITRPATEQDEMQLEARCATRSPILFAHDCCAWVVATGTEPKSLGLFAKVLDEIPEAPEARPPGTNPRPGDPDFNDPAAWGDHNAFQARTVPVDRAPRIEGGAVRRVET
jgi:hypothetical protein